MDRKIAPEAQALNNITLVTPQTDTFSNGLKVYYVNKEDAELIRLEFVFKAGERYSDLPLMARACGALIKNGTDKRTAENIAEAIDYHGAFLETSVNREYASVQIYTLEKYLGEVLEIALDALCNANFPEEEVQIFKENSQQSLLVSLEKVSILARRAMRSAIFGNDHPYGKNTALEDYDKINAGNLRVFHQKHYTIENAALFIAGKVSDEVLKKVQTQFDQLNFSTAAVSAYDLPNIPNAMGEKYMHLQKNDAVQSAIRMGRLMFPKSHEDYAEFTVLNVVLGGYFGSRLMANIREDKGYTYGINSGLMTMSDAGYMVVATEVGAAVTQAAIDEIRKEMNTLREVQISQEELSLVKNYMLGSFMRNIDGAFAQIEMISSAYQQNLPADFYANYLAKIRAVDATRLSELANRYLNPDEFVTITAGDVVCK